MAKQHTNSLIHSSSPYLLQHAQNPVNWIEWSTEAFQQAKEENKLVLISIGYSACHWCHVMEHESFEDEEVAELMNQYLVCIKVDREERPDIDQIYMDAVQLMTNQGGWPLNCFALPDGRPIYGGTYFPKKSWVEVIQKLWKTYQEDFPRVEEYAQRLTEGIIQSELIEAGECPTEFDFNVLIEMVQKWKQIFDFDEGGNNRAPKFPLPNNCAFLLRYGYQKNDRTVLQHVHCTLRKMALGGIYDQLGGGFSRYSVDYLWKVPHFEKMLYDNAQLLSVYAQAYQHTNQPLYKQVIDQTIQWMMREMRHEDKGFYSALDADSEGVEGKFYTWTKEELQQLLNEDFDWLSEFYNINETGYWENGQYILLRKFTAEEWCENHAIPLFEFEEKLSQVHAKLTTVRDQRVRPGLDDKQLTAWNALAIKGLAESGLALQNTSYIDEAKKTAQWLITHQYNSITGQLYRTRRNTQQSFEQGKSKINGFLEDYALVIEALIVLYEITFEKEWIDLAKKLTDYTLANFFDEQSKMFFFTEKDTELFTRKLEINDNVIPASNSVMANNLFKLGRLYHSAEFENKAKQMLSNLYHQISSYGSGYSNWGMLALSLTDNFYEVAITGENAVDLRFELGLNYTPNTVFAGGKEINIPFLHDKAFTKESTIYVCENFTCQAPTQSLSEAVLNLSPKSP